MKSAYDMIIEDLACAGKIFDIEELAITLPRTILIAYSIDGTSYRHTYISDDQGEVCKEEECQKNVAGGAIEPHNLTIHKRSRH
jgi:hypothetical protein